MVPVPAAMCAGDSTKSSLTVKQSCTLDSSSAMIRGFQESTDLLRRTVLLRRGDACPPLPRFGCCCVKLLRPNASLIQLENLSSIIQCFQVKVDNCLLSKRRVFESVSTLEHGRLGEKRRTRHADSYRDDCKLEHLSK